MHGEQMTFTADTAAYDMLEGAHVAGLAVGNGTAAYLMLQRSGDDDPDDWGIYLELSDQASSGYGLVRECRVSRQAVEVDLNEPLAGTTSIRVELAVDDDAFSKFTEGMGAVFRGDHDQLKIEA